MRTHLRIKPFLKKIDVQKLITIISEDNPGLNLTIDEIVTMSNSIKEAIDVDFWEDNPELRFSQMMFNEGFDIFDYVYFMEDEDLLIMCGYDEVEAHGWVSVLDKDKNPIDPVFKFINELDTDHLTTMLTEANEMTRPYSIFMVKMFQKELANRGIEFQLDLKSIEHGYEIWAEEESKRIMEILYKSISNFDSLTDKLEEE